MTEGARTVTLTKVGPDTSASPAARPVAVERPVAIEINGIGYAVLMATPCDLNDLAYGFLRSDRLVDRPNQILSVEPHETPDGFVLRVNVNASCADRIADRVRHRLSESSCGLCGIENLEQAMRPLPMVTSDSKAGESAVFAALAGIETQQHLNIETGAVHAAALCSSSGDILLVREDVGRHNAFDKLLGAMMRQGLDWQQGFALLTSRCSYELVEKAALANCPMLVTISAPTTLALDRAKESHLSLAVLARHDGYWRMGDAAA